MPFSPFVGTIEEKKKNKRKSKIFQKDCPAIFLE